MKFQTLIAHQLFRPAMGAGLAALCGLALWQMPLGDPWINASYDYLFRFGARTVTNKVVLIEMDNQAYDQFKQRRGEPWDRELHAKVLNRLADDGCRMVAFDVFFREPGDAAKDAAFIKAIHRQRQVVLMAKQAKLSNPSMSGIQPVWPDKIFRDAAGPDNYGVAWLDADLDLIVRRHWPALSPSETYSSLPWRMAELCDGPLDETPQERWLRYYRPERAWVNFGYQYALTKPAGFYSNAVVFIGNKPETTLPNDEQDKFRPPHIRWTGEAVGGMEILATEYLNLMNGDWLRRMSGWLEVLALIGTGALVGGGLCFGRPLICSSIAAGSFLAVTIGAVLFSYYTNYWFPWLIIAGGQIPCAITWALATRRLQPVPAVDAGKKKTVVLSPDMFGPVSDHPDAPDYEFFGAPFGAGAFGKVWVVRNSVGQYQALKTVYQSKFGSETKPYEMEFKGIKKFKPLSGEHPGLLRVDFVSMRKKEGYFYYVMELGDAHEPGWEQDPSNYKPRDLATAASQGNKCRLPFLECVDIIASLAEALGFLHKEGFVHRDIKPTNIIFARGRPKLADVGLVTDIRPADQVTSVAGTEHYMPPPPEMPGTPLADIYALGKVLYVISTGNHPRQFPELPPGLLDGTAQGEQFMKLNEVIRKACQPDGTRRYQTAEDLQTALLEVRRALAPTP